MPNRESIIELVVTVMTIVALAVIVIFGSAYGSKGLYEIYGGSAMFGLETLFAVSAYRWSPFLFTTILVGYVWLRVRRRECRWVSWCALSLAALTTALVLYGIVLPFASTTFRMGNQ